jgi:hypothetical protein
MNSAPSLILYKTRIHLQVCIAIIVTRANNTDCIMHTNATVTRGPAEATVSIRFDVPRWFCVRHQDHDSSAPMCCCPRSGDTSRGSRAAFWRVAVEALVGIMLLHVRYQRHLVFCFVHAYWLNRIAMPLHIQRLFYQPNQINCLQ